MCLSVYRLRSVPLGGREEESGIAINILEDTMNDCY